MKEYKILQECLDQRGVPPLLEREQMLDIMQREVYGYLPPAPDCVKWVEEDCGMCSDFGGIAIQKRIKITSYWGEDCFTFSVTAVIPVGKGPFPFFVHVNFTPYVPDKYMPTEEILDRGYAVLSFCYEDISNETPDFNDGLCGLYYQRYPKDAHSPGKIAFWAWACQRVMDYAESNVLLDKTRSVVCGHSRLGKTALLCGATDERFQFVFSNDSGCNGAAITHGKIGENVADSMRIFPYWYCDNYRRYANNEKEMFFDQHFLLSAIAPRFLYVSSAEQDDWADPNSEMLCCVAATAAYYRLGLDGLIGEDRLPKVGDTFHEGRIGYHLRAGTHFFSRKDWNLVMDFIDSKA